MPTIEKNATLVIKYPIKLWKLVTIYSECEQDTIVSHAFWYYNSTDIYKRLSVLNLACYMPQNYSVNPASSKFICNSTSSAFLISKDDDLINNQFAITGIIGFWLSAYYRPVNFISVIEFDEVQDPISIMATIKNSSEKTFNLLNAVGITADNLVIKGDSTDLENESEQFLNDLLKDMNGKVQRYKEKE